VFPDFLLRHRRHRDRSWLLEIVGFWTESYLETYPAKTSCARSSSANEKPPSALFVSGPRTNTMAKTERHRWAFRARFRRNAFGWKSGPAIERIKEAVSEIRKVARNEPVLAAEGAVSFLEKLSPALERIDSSSGAIGSAVNNAIRALVPLIAEPASFASIPTDLPDGGAGGCGVGLFG